MDGIKNKRYLKGIQKWGISNDLQINCGDYGSESPRNCNSTLKQSNISIRDSLLIVAHNFIVWRLHMKKEKHGDNFNW